MTPRLLVCACCVPPVTPGLQTGSSALRVGISKDSDKCGSLSAGDVVLVRARESRARGEAANS